MSSNKKENQAQACFAVVEPSATVVEETVQNSAQDSFTQANTVQVNTTQDNAAQDNVAQDDLAAALLQTLNQVKGKSNLTSGDRAALNILKHRLDHTYIDKGQYFCEWLASSPLMHPWHKVAKGQPSALELPCELLLRPHRFGKTFFLDVLQSIYEGRKELFTDTYLDHHWNWQQTPLQVIRIDFRELLQDVTANAPFTYCAIGDPRLEQLRANKDLFNRHRLYAGSDAGWVDQAIADLCRVSQNAFDASLLPSSTTNASHVAEFIDHFLTKLYDRFYQECTKSVNELEQAAFRNAMARATERSKVDEAVTVTDSMFASEDRADSEFEDSLQSFAFAGEPSDTAHVDNLMGGDNLASCLSYASPRTALWQLSILLKSCRPQSRVLLIDNLDAPLFDCLPHWEVYNYFSRFFNGFFSIIANCRSTFVRIVATSTINYRQLPPHMRNVVRSPILPITTPFCGQSLGKICGFTEEEVKATLDSGLEQARQRMNNKRQPDARYSLTQVVQLLREVCGGYFFGTNEEILHPHYVFDFFVDPLLQFKKSTAKVSLPDWDYIADVGHYNNLELFALLSQLFQGRSYSVNIRNPTSNPWLKSNNRGWGAKQIAIYDEDPFSYTCKDYFVSDPLGKWSTKEDRLSSLVANLLSEKKGGESQDKNIGRVVDSSSSSSSKAVEANVAHASKAVPDQAIATEATPATVVEQCLAQKNPFSQSKAESKGNPYLLMEWATLAPRMVPYMPLFNRNHFESALALLELHGFSFKKQAHLKYLFSSLGLGGDPIFGILLGNILLANDYLQHLFSDPYALSSDEFFKVPKDVAQELNRIREVAFEEDTSNDLAFITKYLGRDGYWNYGEESREKYDRIFKRQYKKYRKSDRFSAILREISDLQVEQIKEQFTKEAECLGQHRVAQETKVVASKAQQQHAVMELSEPVWEQANEVSAPSEPSTNVDADADAKSLSKQFAPQKQVQKQMQAAQGTSSTAASSTTKDAATQSSATAQSPATARSSNDGVLFTQLQELALDGKTIATSGQVVQMELPNLMREQLYEIVHISQQMHKRLEKTQEAMVKSKAERGMNDRIQVGTQSEAEAAALKKKKAVIRFVAEALHFAPNHLLSSQTSQLNGSKTLVGEDGIVAATIAEDAAIKVEPKLKPVARAGVHSDGQPAPQGQHDQSDQQDQKASDVLTDEQKIEQQQNQSAEPKPQATKSQPVHEEPDSAVIKSLKELPPEQFFVAMMSMATVTQEALDAIVHVAISVTNLQDLMSVDGSKHFQQFFPRYNNDLSVPKTFYPLLEPGLCLSEEGGKTKVVLKNEKDRDSDWFKLRQDLYEPPLWNSYTPNKVKGLLESLSPWDQQQMEAEYERHRKNWSLYHLDEWSTLRSEIGPYTLGRVAASFDSFLMPNVLENLAQALYLGLGAKYQLAKLLNTYSMLAHDGYDTVHLHDLLQSLGLVNIKRLSYSVSTVKIANCKARELMRRSLLNWCFDGYYSQYAMSWANKELRTWTFFTTGFNYQKHVSMLDAVVRSFVWKSASQFSSAFICRILQLWLVMNVAPAWLESNKLQILVGKVEPPLPPSVARRYAMEKARSYGINLDCEKSIVEMFPEFYPQQHHCLAYIVNETEATIFEIVYLRSIEHSYPVMKYMSKKLLAVTNPVAALLNCHPQDEQIKRIKVVRRLVLAMCFLRDGVQLIGYERLPNLKVPDAAETAVAPASEEVAAALGASAAAVDTTDVASTMVNTRSVPDDK